MIALMIEGEGEGGAGGELEEPRALKENHPLLIEERGPIEPKVHRRDPVAPAEKE